MADALPAVHFNGLDVIFGPTPKRALALLDQGRTRSEILAETGDTLAVSGAELSVPSGELCVLMGLSGSGKSSLLRCVNGLNKATRGRMIVRHDGQEVDVAKCDEATLRKLRADWVSMVFQQFALMPWRTIRENVGLGLELRGMPKAERDRIVDEKLAMVHLDKWGEKYPRELSGGMQQRVGLARAFATDADILLMDEPFSALDPLIRTHLQDELLELQHRLMKTIIFVSHDLDEALKIGNRIVIMESGRIVQVGTPEEIVTRPADDYVASFVAHVNPLNVLRAEALMTPLAALPREGDFILVDKARTCRCRIDGLGRPIEVTQADRLLQIADGMMNGMAPGQIATMPVHASMRRFIAAHEATRQPILVLDDDGCLVGKVGESELVARLLRGKNI